MPSTPVHALPYPTGADPADVPADLQGLAEAIEAALAAMILQDTQSASISATGVLTGISITPGAGTFLAIATAQASYEGAPGSGTSVGLALRVNGVNVISGPLAEAVAVSNAMQLPLVVAGVITPSAGQAVEVHCTFTGGSSKFANSGRLILVGPF